MPTHEAGWAHADGALRGPELAARARRPQRAGARRSGRRPRTRSTATWSSAGSRCPDLVANVNTPAYVLDEADFRARARAFREAFAAYDVFYAGKAFLCTTVARWVAEEGLCLDVCSDGELTVALRAGFDPARIGYHGNTKTELELRRAVAEGVGRIIVDSFDEIDRLERVTASLGRTQAVMVRVTAGVEAHTHEYIATAHEDQKFGFSITSGDALEAVRRVVAAPGLELLGLHSHIGSQIFDTSGFEVAARRVLALHAQVALRGRRDDARARPRRRLRHRLHDRGRPLGPRAAGDRDEQDRRARVPGPRRRASPGCRSSPAARSSARRCAPSTRSGTVKRVELDGGAVRTYVSVDGGMSDNIRTALYDADYSCTLASRESSTRRRSLARVVGKHCEAGDIVVKDEFLPGDVRPGDLLAVPSTGAYCRSMASNYNHALRPPVVAVRDGVATTIVRRETVDDLLATDLGATV